MTQLTDNTWYTSDYISPLQLFIRLTRGNYSQENSGVKPAFVASF